MLTGPSRRFIAALVAIAAIMLPARAPAQSPQVFDPDATRYMALGDSIAVGFKVTPATQGYPYDLYQGGAFDQMPHTLFNNIAAVGATSATVLAYQVPQALIPAAAGGFGAKYITLTVGGLEIIAVLQFAVANPNNPAAVAAFAQATLASYAKNLTGILGQLSAGLPGVKIFVANHYTIPDLEALIPGSSQIIDAFNLATQQVVGTFPANAFLVDVYGAFIGRRNLIQLERPHATLFEVHPTTTGQQVMTRAFEDVIAENK